MKKKYLNLTTRILSLFTAISFGFITTLLLYNMLKPTYESIFNPFFLFITSISIFIFILSIYHLVTGKYTKLFISIFIIAGLIIFLDKGHFLEKKPSINLISTTITSELEKNNWGKIDFSKITIVNFDHVCIFGPYSTNERIENILGFKWDIEAKTNIQLEDGHNVIVFVQNNQVIQYIKHPRNLGDFSSLSGKCFDKYNSKLIRTKTKKGFPSQWIHLDNPTSQTNKSIQETTQ